MTDTLAALQAELAAMKERQAALEAEVRQARDFQAVQNLQAAYGYYVDKGLWDNAADLFAEDGTLELAGRGVYIGRERVRAYLHHLPAYGEGMLYNHMQLQPVIHVDSAAGTAKGRWRSFMMVGSVGNEARWGEATYENAYRRVDGEWKIAQLHGYMNIYVDFYEGWNKGGVKLLRSIDGLQPDAPPTMEYECFPAPLIAPFHYDKV
ncbi:nuclear transport factor 2 family protein [Alteraurantiacibacter buctensis]|uniref:Nuclear transport factor 2 family protein n=1 Tax=Alteraurantiacibacter buctensis TaxID=1503981 RepID=A0A844YV43_9SPHN|nr:nuclear transport factor 2 family protein [Alteraurantiacibacter buctensis]MXO71012.1 nuclear transport factor 2 family protein [Alteraurantiacibacter buctensis]